MESVEGSSWKAGQAEAWLKSVGRTAATRDELRARVDALRAAADGVKAIDYSKLSASGMPSDGAAAAAIEALDSAALLDELAREASSRVSDAIMRLYSISEPDRMLLEMRYVHNMPWSEVADALGVEHATARGTMKRRALRAAYEVMPHHERVMIPRADCS